ncbi:MAG: prolipoprotein diacylglyceryl transferase [Brevinema sp.]
MYLTHPPISVEIFSLGPLSIRWYSMMYIFGFLFFSWWTQREITKNRLSFSKNNTIKVSKEIVTDMLFYSMLGIIIGGRLGYALLYNAHYYFIEDPLAIFRPWEGGMSFHGAFIGTYIACQFAIQKMKKITNSFNLLDLSDVILVSVPMGLAFGRIGNFINGELYGRPTSVPWGMIFPKRPELGHYGAPLLPIEQVQHLIDQSKLILEPNITSFIINGQEMVQVPRHPSQLYHVLLEGLMTLAIQLFFYYKVPVSKSRGFLTGTFLISYGCSRIFTEFFREPDTQIGFLAGEWLTAGMLYSLPMIFIGLGLMIYALKKRIPNPIRVN